MTLADRARGAWRGAVNTGSALAALGLLNSVRNLRIVPTPAAPTAAPGDARPTISVLLPLRDEAHRVGPCLRALTAQGCAEILVLDDASSDGTADVVRTELGGEPRLRVLVGSGEPPPGWLGKPWACERLARAATGDVLVFVDADVVLTPHAVERAAAMLTDTGYAIVCPYPRQVTTGPLGRLVQPLLQWSWLTTLPLDVAARSPRPSTAAGNGQFLVVRAEAYRRAGGHAAVRTDVLEDVALVRAIKSVGGSGGMADGTSLATCRMYDSDTELIAGYGKSLWAAFGSPAGAAGALALLGLAYVVPAAGALVGPDRRTRLIGLTGYAAATAGRVLIAARTRQRMVPDAFAHPLSIAAFTGLVAASFRRRRRGELSWRGRPVVVGPRDSEAPHR